MKLVAIDLDFECDWQLDTDGNGHWSDKAKGTKVTRIQILGHPREHHGSMFVYFDKSTWNVDEDGLIYTDPQWLEELRTELLKMGFLREDVMDMDYSEQGRQTDEYVDLDVGKGFMIKALLIAKVNCEL